MWKYFLLFIGISSLKFLLLPAYFSTDFEVHRNWLAITKTLPFERWYYEDTSIWTLDYPPFFAWLEYILAKIAVLFDPEMVKIDNLDYRSDATILFQRSSVIFLDLVYFYGVLQVCKAFLHSDGSSSTKVDKLKSPVFIGLVLLLTSPGLLIVDHIHFQYNGFLSGLLFLSIARMKEGQYVSSAFWFTVLLNFKHIYLYVAPAYFVFLLVAYCGTGGISTFVKRVATLGMIVLSIFGLSFGPFAKHILQVLSRLFPFQRGLCHAYWAPNVWAIYNVVDKVAALAGYRLGYLKMSEPEPEPIVEEKTVENSWLDVVSQKALELWKVHIESYFGIQGTEKPEEPIVPPANLTRASMTGGLVQQFDHVILPSVAPKATFVLTVLSMLPILYVIARRRSSQSFLEGVVACSLSSFLFGWHVHEKAILLPLLPLTVLALKDEAFIKPFLLLSITGHVSLFPLLFTPFESVLKVFLVLFYTSFSVSCLSKVHSKMENFTEFMKLHLSSYEVFYLLGLIPVALHEVFLHKFTGLHDRMPFLPLLVMSVYCAVGVIYSWFVLLTLLFNVKKLKSE